MDVHFRSTKLNQHFVPKYLFRLHNGGASNIHLLRKDAGDVIWNASIRGQCARNKYYGSKEFEEWLGYLDDLHAIAFRALVQEAWNASMPLTERETLSLYQAAMLQRARVPRTLETNVSWTKQMYMHVFREFAAYLPDEDQRKQTLQAIERGQARFEGFELDSLIHSILTHVRFTIGILDLRIAVVRNRTDIPFVFGDCPCVFYNRLLYDWKDRGVLGFRTPGLMVIHPIQTNTLLMLYDSSAYSIESANEFVDVTEMSDVSQFNALQLHSAMENVYFHHPDSCEYLLELYAAHKATFQNNFGQFRIHSAGRLNVAGTISSDEAMHVYERQLPHRLDLSFVTTHEQPKVRNMFLSRGGEIDEILHRTNPFPNESMSVDEVVGEMESKIRES